MWYRLTQMKKLTILTFIIIAISSCSISKKSLRFEIRPTLIVNKDSSAYINELRIGRVYSSSYCGELMYTIYGKWDTVVWRKGSGAFLIWEKRKLIKSKNELYSVATLGSEDALGPLGTLVVFDSKGRDCLEETSEDRDSLIKYFSSAVKKHSDDYNKGRNKDFYTLLKKMVKEHRDMVKRQKRTPL